MDLSIFRRGLTTSAYQKKVKRKSTPPQPTNIIWLENQKEKVEEMNKEKLFNNILRRNKTPVDGYDIFFRLLGFKNKTLSMVYEGDTINVLPCEDYSDGIGAYKTAIHHYETDADFRSNIDAQLEQQGAEIVPLEEGVDEG